MPRSLSSSADYATGSLIVWTDAIDVEGTQMECRQRLSAKDEPGLVDLLAASVFRAPRPARRTREQVIRVEMSDIHRREAPGCTALTPWR